MKFCRLYISRYEWQVVAFFDAKESDAARITEELLRIDCPDEVIKRVEKNLRRGRLDTGFTYSNRVARCSVMTVGHASSSKEFLNSYAHELRHLVDDIASASYLPMRGEGVGYLTGELSWEFMDEIGDFLCCRCHRD